MYSILFLAIVSFLVALLLTPVVRDVFRRGGMVDAPTGGRKIHTEAIPRVGGIAIAIGYVVAFSGLLLLRFNGGAAVWRELDQVIRLLPAAGLIFAVGLYDDLRGLKPWPKFLLQFAAAGLAFWGGVRVMALHGHGLNTWWWSIPVTLFWLVFCTNAFNLIDGVDGLATGVGLFATLTTLAAGLMQGNYSLVLATVPLAGAMAGFLRYNFNPASIFLGDSGSYTIGFLLGCFGILWSQKAATILGITAPLMAFAVPLLDTSLSIVRRFLRRQPIFGADRGHIHHKLLDMGMTTRRAVLVLYGAAGVGAGLALIGSASRNPFAGLVLVLFAAVAWVGIQSLGYVELNMASRLLFRGSFRRVLNAELALRSARLRLMAARSAEEYWAGLDESCVEMGFQGCSLRVDGLHFSTEGDHQPGWWVTVPLGERGEVQVWHDYASDRTVHMLAPFAELLWATIGQFGVGEWPGDRTDRHVAQAKARAAAVAGGRDEIALD
ncbi:MraY family glycosyltransferase [uncultured Paludibaculum sp.]|uniref:MraY family glycosyltransferase n=1 Tax=uncultured Paludibaculum sp. TaxID=1765020 RepID=UPI002AAAEEFC|nr:MraY family glycosyltransferase [uncultured Paludibaculum sp.]